MQQSSFHEYLDNKLLLGLLQNVQQKRDKTVCHYSSISVLLVVSKLERN